MSATNFTNKTAIKKIFTVSAFMLMVALGTNANAYMIGNSYATLLSCNYNYNADYGSGGYTGIYRALYSGGIYYLRFQSYCPY